MGERVKQVTGKVKDIFSRMSRRVKLLLLLLLIVLVGLLVGLGIYRSTRPYTVLFTGLSGPDMSAVLTYLGDNGVNDYKVQNNDTILVRASEEQALKAGILQQGYPTSGYAYSTYLDNIGMLSSESDRQQLTIYDLQDQLSSVIGRFDDVQSATVNLAMASDNRYILSDTVVDASAAVQVKLQPGKTLSSQLVNAIRNYVSHSVQGLSFSNVRIMDTEGHEVSGSADSAALSDSADLKLSLEAQVDSNTRSKIMTMLEPLFGYSNITVSVHSTVDVSHTYQESLHYIEPEWAQDGSARGQGIIGSWVWDSGIVRGTDAAAGGVAGTSTNADLNEYVINQGDITGNEQEIGTSGQRDYLVSQENTQSESQGGMVTDLMVAVAINSRSVENPSDINTRSLLPLVARAAGISSEYEAEKIAIDVYPFFQETPEEEPAESDWLESMIDRLPPWARYAAIAGGVLFLILLITALLVVRKLKKRKKKKTERLTQLRREQELAAFAPETAVSTITTEAGADIMDLNTERSMELRRDVRQFAEDNPAIAAQMVKNWLRGSEER